MTFICLAFFSPLPSSLLTDCGSIFLFVLLIICEPVCLFTVLAHGRDGGLQRSHFFVRPWAPLAIYPGTAATDARCPRAHDAQHPKCGLAVALAYMIVQDQVQLFSILDSETPKLGPKPSKFSPAYPFSDTLPGSLACLARLCASKPSNQTLRHSGQLVHVCTLVLRSTGHARSSNFLVLVPAAQARTLRP